MISELKHSFSELERLISQLQTNLSHAKPQHWLPLTQFEQAYADSLQVLTGLIGDLWYQDAQDGRETRARHGMVLVNNEQAELIKRINAQKDDFKQRVKLTRARLGEASLREALHFTELTRIHLRQCYRHLPLLTQWPKKVGFSWYVSGRSIRRLSLEEAEAALMELGEDKPHIQVQLQKLYQLPPHTELAQMQNLAPTVRANIVFADAKKAMNAPLPLFIPDAGKGLPEFNQIDLTPPESRQRKVRNDSKVEGVAYLPSIRAHLYR